MQANVVWHDHLVTRQERWALKGQRGVAIWFTGLSGSGKSTVANAVDVKLTAAGRHTYVLDGDNLRHGLNKGLGFSAEDRQENVRRMGEVARLMVDLGIIVLVPIISPYREDRDRVRRRMGDGEFIEVYVATPLNVCEERDPKGLYAKARKGEITNLTGIGSPYEAPADPELVLGEGALSPDLLAQEVVEYLRREGYLGMLRGAQPTT